MYKDGLKGDRAELPHATEQFEAARLLRDKATLDSMADVVHNINTAATHGNCSVTVDRLEREQISLLRCLGYVTNRLCTGQVTISWTMS